MINEYFECFICGSGGALHKHHCLHGIRRKAADKYDLTVWLCPECHQRLHDRGDGDLMLERLAQRHFEKEHGHDEYMRIFGKNYL